jgi:hypothetical protein
MDGVEKMFSLRPLRSLRETFRRYLSSGKLLRRASAKIPGLHLNSGRFLTPERVLPDSGRTAISAMLGTL